MKRLFIFLFLASCAAINQPTALDFGDSVSLQGYAGPARFYLWDIADFRHDHWENEDIIPSDTTSYYTAAYNAGLNNWDSARLLSNMTQQLERKHYTIIAFNAGIHDEGEGVSLTTYRNNLEAIAQTAEFHADYVLWIDSAPNDAGIDAYNAVGQQVAAEHHFCILSPSYPHSPNPGMHYTIDEYKTLGREVADKVLTILSQGCP